MHSIWTGVTPYVVGMCNCDRDCGAYNGYLQGRQHFFRAEYVCQVDVDALHRLQVVHEPVPVRRAVLLVGAGQGVH